MRSDKRKRPRQEKRTDVQTKLASQEDLIGQIEKNNCPNILYLKDSCRTIVIYETNLMFVSKISKTLMRLAVV